MSERRREAGLRRWATIPPDERAALTAAARASSIERRRLASALLRTVEQRAGDLLAETEEDRS